jgi:hypothetical protein
MDIDDEAYPKIRKSTSKWKCGFSGLRFEVAEALRNAWILRFLFLGALDNVIEPGI